MNESPQRFGVRFTSFALNNAVPMNLLFVVLVILSVMVIRSMPVDVYPDVSFGEATIDTVWLGASAEDVERLITDRIEDEIQDIRGIVTIISDSKPDASLIRVKFKETLSDSGLDAAIRELRAAVDQVIDLPEDAKKPVVSKMSIGEVVFLLWVAIEDIGDVGEEVLHNVAFRLKPVLREVPGVAKIDDMLVREREVHIEANRDALRQHGLTIKDVGEVLRQYNRNLPSGTLQQSKSEITVRFEGSVTAPQQLGSIVVAKSASGGHVYLRDVATIETSFARKTFFARYNLNECLALGVAKTDGADARAVAVRVRAALDEFKKALPPGVGLKAFDDTSEIIRDRLRVLTTNMAGGAMLVFIVLWVTMGLRNSILAIVGIPFSFGFALICMNLLGVSINAVSLIGLVLCAGMIVDDAIVVLENIYRIAGERKIRPGDRTGLWNAIVDGAGEVWSPVIFSSATTIAAFLPLLMMTGLLGEFFSIIPKTVTAVLLASLFECLVILPVHYLDFSRRTRVNPDGQSKPGEATAAPARSLDAARSAVGWGKRVYRRMLKATLRHRYVAPLPLLGLGLLAYAVLPLIDVELFPSEFQQILVDVHVADEASLDQTGEIVKPIEALVLARKDICAGVLTSFGLMMTDENAMKLRSNLAQLHVQLAPGSALGADSVAAANALRESIEQYVANNPQCGVVSFRVQAPRSGPPIGKPVSIRIESPDFRTAKLLAERYRASLSGIDGVLGIRDNLEFGQQQINVAIDEARASLHGLTSLGLASVLRTANDGLIVSTFKDRQSGEDLKVRLFLAERFRGNLGDLMDLDVRCAGGYMLQMRQLTDLDMTQGYAGIPHHNGKRAVTLTAEIDTTKTTAYEVNRRIQNEFEPTLAMMSDVRVVYGGQFSETQESFQTLGAAYVVAMVVIYFLLATQFRSYGQPFVVICSIPFAGIGVVGGLLLSGYPFTIMTFIAIVGMSGIVVNDSILLVDCANQKRKEGCDLLDALESACLQRLRPILLTTVTTVLGLMPLALGIGGASHVWSPFAASFMWGLAFSTAITLFVIPVAYAVAHDIGRSGVFFDQALKNDRSKARQRTT